MPPILRQLLTLKPGQRPELITCNSAPQLSSFIVQTSSFESLNQSLIAELHYAPSPRPSGERGPASERVRAEQSGSTETLRPLCPTSVSRESAGRPCDLCVRAFALACHVDNLHV